MRATAPLLALLVAASGSVAACSSPQAHIDAIARSGGLAREIVRGAAFRHVIYRPQRARPGPELHVYIEGDGAPYFARTVVSADPTPRTPLALELMLEDPAPALYLGRPCYLGLVHDPPCTSADWTIARFSPAIVASLVAALEQVLGAQRYAHVTLIGHSGGAALALLVADRVEVVDRVVTIAGNLDVAGWTALHRYTPLSGSLDPLTSGAHRSGIELIHLAGSADHNVPTFLIRGAAERLGGRVLVIPGFNHRCCWRRLWPRLLQEDFRDATI